MKNTSDHYDSSYFEFQTAGGEFGGWANKSHFQEYIKPADVVLDFGCGGGYLLKNIACKGRIGVEINKAAVKVAKENRIKVYSEISKVPANVANVIISNHALEHSLNPYFELKQLHRALKKGGKLIIYVPCESIFHKHKKNDSNHHLFTWSPMCLGNLLTEAGFELIEARAAISMWPPKYLIYGKFLSPRLFNFLSKIYGWLRLDVSQVMAVAIKR